MCYEIYLRYTEHNISARPAKELRLCAAEAPIYTMRSPDPRSFSRNKRGIAGTLIWVNFDRHALLDPVRRMAGKFVANIDDIRPQYAFSDQISRSAIFSSKLVRDAAVPVGATLRTRCTRSRRVFVTLQSHFRGRRRCLQLFFRQRLRATVVGEPRFLERLSRFVRARKPAPCITPWCIRVRKANDRSV